MKRILIAGANSYIGTSVEKYLHQWPEKYRIDTIDMLDRSWRETNFVGYDVVFFVAGIVHKKETPLNVSLYYLVNCDLAVEIAEKAKLSGVGQFIYMSSMSVYGIDEGAVTPQTTPSPKSHYGKSKFKAEKYLTGIATDKFLIALLRPPMVYGRGCKGNYRTLSSLAKKARFFPKVSNTRSILYIGNFCEFVKQTIDNRLSGVFCPQNSSYICTSKFAEDIAKANGKTLHLTKLLNPLLGLMGNSLYRKVFGSLYYELDRQSVESCSAFSYDESIILTEQK